MKWFTERDEKYTNTEYSLKDRHAFQQRWDNAMSDGGTLARSSTVVLWTKLSDDPPLWVRQIQKNENKRKWFSKHTASQRSFDAVKNIWHLCTGFEEEETPRESDANDSNLPFTNDDLPLDDQPSTARPFDLPDVEKVEATKNRVSRFSDWTGFVTSFHSPPKPAVVLQRPPLLDYMFFRYGFTFPPKADYPDHQDWAGDLDDKEFWKLKCILSDPDSPENSVSFRRHAFNFVKYVCGAEDIPPHPLLDLRPENAKFIGREPRCGISYPS